MLNHKRNTFSTLDMRFIFSCLVFENGCLCFFRTWLFFLTSCDGTDVSDRLLYASEADEQDAKTAADATSHIKDFPLKLFELWRVWRFRSTGRNELLGDSGHHHTKHPLLPTLPILLMHRVPQEFQHSLEIASVSASSTCRLCNVCFTARGPACSCTQYAHIQ